jgi:hypothetical protein
MSQAGDPRFTLARAEQADLALEGIVAAPVYTRPHPFRLRSPSAGMFRAADPASERVDELIYGERFDALGETGEFLWGQARRDGYVGYVHRDGPVLAEALPTHRVRAIRSFAFVEPSIKSRPAGPFSLNALVNIEAEEGAFARSEDGLWFWREHLAPIGVFEPDPAAVAERFLGAPYLWGGRTSIGLDCSALVQQSLYACGRSCPRDSDLIAGLGRSITREELRRTDLVCWRGHVGMMLDETRLIHANGRVMAVEIEPVDEAIARIEPGSGATLFRRL